MKIYFAGSIRGGRDDQELYFAIIKEVAKYGSVLTEHIGDKELTGLGEQTKTDSFIFERDIEWVREADVIVAEVSTPSLGVGYEIGQAQALGKRILCLYRETEGKRLSAMVAGNSYPTVKTYCDLHDIQTILKDYFGE